jgi:hypothetical protein
MVALQGVSKNTRHISLLKQQLGNPLDRSQHPEISLESVESRLPSTFHSNSANEQNQAPSNPVLAPTMHNSEDGIQPPTAIQTNFQANVEETNNF